jgi:hypothetical protein
MRPDPGNGLTALTTDKVANKAERTKILVRILLSKLNIIKIKGGSLITIQLLL